MTDKLIPANARRAAARGFIRTASQSLATSFIGFGGLTIALTGDGLLALAVGIGGATVTRIRDGIYQIAVVGRALAEERNSIETQVRAAEAILRRRIGARDRSRPELARDAARERSKAHALFRKYIPGLALCCACAGLRLFVCLCCEDL